MKKGFTIIETTLVLAISSLFAVGLMIGWSVNINRQRYEDSVNTLKSDIQDIFNEVENPKNSRSDNVKCEDNGTNISLSENSSDKTNNRGATNCVIIGKFVVLSGDTGVFSGEISENSVYVRDIYGKDIDITRECSGRSCTSSIDALKATKFVIADGKNAISSSPIKQIDLQWGANFKNITDNRSNKFTAGLKNEYFSSYGGKMIERIRSFMILRSPIDGSIMVFGVPIFDATSATSSYMNRDSEIKKFRDWAVDSNILMNSSKTINLCVRNPSSSRWLAGEAVFGRNKVIKIGGSTNSVEIAPLDGGAGTGSMSCGNEAGFDDVLFEGSALK